MLTLEQVKSKSTSRLSGLHPAVKAATEYLIERCHARGVPILITQGLRTKAEQNALFAKGRTQAQLNAVGLSHVKAQPDESKVTNAIGGTSYHNYGLAVDFALLLPNGSTASWDMKRDGNNDKTADWLEVVQEAKNLGFDWGGDFISFKDYPHFQMSFGLSISQLKSGREPAQAAADAVYSKISKLKKEENDVRVDKAKTVVNGKELAEESVLIEGRTYVPLAAVGKALGATVGWDNATKTATITLKGDK